MDGTDGRGGRAFRHFDELLVGYLLLAVMVATGLPTPLYPLYRKRLGLSSLDITAVYGVYAVAVLIVLLAAGGLSDRVGRRRVLAIAVSAAAIAEVLLLAAPTIGGLYAGRVVIGVSIGLVLGSATAYLTEIAGPGGERRAAATAVVANLGGQAVGTLLAGVLARFLPAPLATAYLFGLVMLCPVALLWLLQVPDVVTAEGRWRQGLRLRPLSVPSVVQTRFWSTAAALVATFSLLGFLTALTGAILAERTNHPGGLLAGVLTAGLFASAALAQLSVPERAFDRASTAALATLPLAVVLLALADLARSLPLLLGAVLLTGSVVGVTLRAGIGRVLAQCPPAQRGQLSSALFVAVYTGASVPTIAAGLIATLAGLTTAVLSLGAFVIVLTAGAATMSLRSRPEPVPVEQ